MNLQQPEVSAPPSHRPPPSRRRDKPQLSCDLCRKRKLKCDRGRPCNRCSSHGIASSCTYPVSRKPETSSPKGPVRTSDTLQQRLEDLEEQIISLIDPPIVRSDSSTRQDAVSSQSPSQTPTQPMASPTVVLEKSASERAPTLNRGNLRSSSTGSVYVDASHWTAILDDLSDLKGRVQRQDDIASFPTTTSYDPEGPVIAGPQLLFGSNRPATRESLLAMMPERSVVDRMIFDLIGEGGSVFMFCLHMRAFQKQYDQFWENPNEVSMLWLALLYAVMCLSGMARAGAASAQSGDDSIMQQAFRQPKYLNEVVSCLILGDYPSGGPHALEALFHYLCIEHIRRTDSESQIWVLMGTIIRLAIRMGYHRDPSQLPGVTPFQAEMRRRMWAALYYGETLFSIQAGVPRMINDSQCDTQPPSNLLDSDFDENTVVMPASRPLSEFTQVHFTIARFNLSKVLSSIADLGNSLEHNPEQVQIIEKALQKIHEELPPPLKMGNGSVSFTDTPYIILCRLIWGILFEKCKILLYRRCLDTFSPFETASECDHAPSSLISASLKVLEYQAHLDREIQPDGILWTTRWKLSSTVMYEFHMAAAVLAKMMYRAMGECPTVSLSMSTQADIIAALKRSYQIWMGLSSRSREAIKSVKMLDALFAKIESGGEPSPAPWGWDLSKAVENNILPDEHTIFHFPL